MSRKMLCLFLLSAISYANPVSAEICEDNFTVSGSFLSGKTYKTWAEVPSQNIENAFAPIASFTRENGFKILESNKEAGSISAVQAVSYANGKKIPLDIALESSDGGLKVSLIYITPMGVFSPDDAIKTHFCKTIAVAAQAKHIERNNTAATSSSADKVAPTNKMPAGFVAITTEQTAQIRKETEKKIADAKLRALIADAAPTLQEFVGKMSCHTERNPMKLNALFAIYAAPGKHLYPQSPMIATKFHNNNTCLNVARIQGWNAPALNALQFEVVYLAEDSGESTKSFHEMVKQPDGIWLFNR